MPLYEYYCRTCDKRFELMRSFKDADAPAACPEGHPSAKKLLSVFATVTAGGDAGPSDMACGACGSDTPGACNLN